MKSMIPLNGRDQFERAAMDKDVTDLPPRLADNAWVCPSSGNIEVFDGLNSPSLGENAYEDL